MNTLIYTVFSHDDTSIMLVALLSLFLVFFFVTLLHCYARWFLAQDSESRPSMVLVIPPVVGAHHLFILRHLLSLDSTHENDDLASPVKGLEPCVISSIPQFVFRQDEEEGYDHGLECVVCLSLFESGEKCKRLALCNHAFHVECIDMWLHSHTTCPVCRAPAVKVSENRYVVHSISESHEIGQNEQNLGVGLSETTTSFDETRVSGEDHGRLEIVVEVPNKEDGSNGACQHKVVASSIIVV